MRKRFEDQKSLFCYDIQSAVVPIDCRDAIPALFASLKAIYMDTSFRERLLNLISKILGDKKQTGRKGLNLWQIFTLTQTRLCLSLSYDRLHYLVNQDMLFRHILGIRDTSDLGTIQWDYQRIYDNVNLFTDAHLQEINSLIVEFGHGVFKKKETEVMRLKTDSYVVESNVHFPTDYNLLWDCARKCLDMIHKIIYKYPEIKGWRKRKHWRRDLKKLYRTMGQVGKGGGKNKEERVKKTTELYLIKNRLLLKKLADFINEIPINDLSDMVTLTALQDYMRLLDKHIDLVDRRILQGEKIPHEEKMFSIFEQYTEWINKGKSHPNVELGKKVSITTDQYNLIVDFEIMESTSDSQIVIPLVDRILTKYEVDSWSFDKGYWHKDNKAHMIDKIDHVIMPKKGKLNQEERVFESTNKFKELRNKHSAVESNINELEHRGLDRCPDRSYPHFKRYIGLGVISYNMHKIGKELIRQQLSEERKAKSKKQKKLHAAA